MALAGLWVLLVAPPALAAPKDAKTIFETAQRAYQLGRFEEALAGYEQALELSGKSVLLFNIAQCHRQLSHFDRAAFFYGRFLASVPPSHPHAKVATELLAEMDAKQREAQANQQRSAEAERLLRAAEVERQRAERQRAEALRLQAEADREHAQAARLQEELRQRELTGVRPGPLSPLGPAGVTEARPLTSRWYFWAGVGAAVLAAGSVAYVASAPGPRPNASLGDVSY